MGHVWLVLSAMGTIYMVIIRFQLKYKSNNQLLFDSFICLLLSTHPQLFQAFIGILAAAGSRGLPKPENVTNTTWSFMGSSLVITYIQLFRLPYILTPSLFVSNKFFSFFEFPVIGSSFASNSYISPYSSTSFT